MTASDKLKAIERLTLKDGLTYADHHDIGHWVDACRDSAGDTSVLTPKSIERIEAIFVRFFVEA